MMPSPDALTRRLPRPDDDTTPETGPDRGECECGDWRDQHVLGRGPCEVCRDCTTPGYGGCQRYREARSSIRTGGSRQPFLTTCQITTKAGVMDPSDSRPSLTQDVPPHHPTHGHHRPNPERQDQQ